MKFIRRILGGTLLLATLSFITIPFLTTSWHLVGDRGLRSASPSFFAFKLHHSLSKQLPRDIDERIASGRAETLGPSCFIDSFLRFAWRLLRPGPVTDRKAAVGA